MKTINYRNIGSVLAALFLLPGYAQAQDTLRLADGKIRVENLQVNKGNDSMEVRITLNLDSLAVPSNRFMKFTPVLVSGDDAAVLDPIVIAGRRQHIMYRRVREKEARRDGANPVVIRRENRKAQSVRYRASVPYAAWMATSALHMAEDLCGCGGSPLAQSRTHLTDCDFDRSVYEVRPLMAYVAPAAEAVKHREESGSAFLDFPVNKTVIHPDYRGNADELAKIRRTIDLVRNDTNTRITRITIHGYASPEGTWQNNARLAQGRAEALKEYVRRLYHFDGVRFDVQSTPEDWDGLRRFVAGSDMECKESLLAIIDSDLEPDARNWKLQTVDGKRPYDFLLANVYPKLRHSDYTVEYTVRAFNVEEAKQLLKTRPQLLSLNEMFLIAQTYEPGSAEFNEVFDIAVRMFPDDPTANLNAANAAISEGALQRAATYLAKAGDTPEAVHARGVLLLLQGEYAGAEMLLQQARQRGVREAETNLEQLRLKRKNVRKLSAY